jgi:hypothetical protein
VNEENMKQVLLETLLTSALEVDIQEEIQDVGLSFIRQK